MVVVTFELDLGGGCVLGEAQLADLEPLGDRLAEQDELSGAVVIAVTDEPHAHIEDALAPLAIWLCANNVVTVLDGGSATYLHYEYGGTVQLEPVADDVIRIAGDLVGELTVERVPLLTGLVACGERIAAFMRAAGDPAFADVIPAVEQARQALTAHGLDGSPTP